MTSPKRAPSRARRPPGARRSTAADLHEIAAGAQRSVRAALGPRAQLIRVTKAEGSGFRTLARSRGSRRGGRRLAEARRAAAESVQSARAPARPGEDLAVLPLVVGQRVFGTIEAIASSERMDAAWGVLQAVARQTARSFRGALDKAETERELEVMSAVSALVGELVRAESPQAAVRAATRLCHRFSGRPVAGWLVLDDSMRLLLSGASGLGEERGGRLRQEMPTLRPWQDLSTDERVRELHRFGRIAGAAGVEAIDAGDAVLLAATGGRALPASFETVASLLADALRHLAVVARAERRNRHLDLGIAWTAHELRGPLLGVSTMIEQLLHVNGDRERQAQLLRASLHELRQLAELTHALLSWSAGSGFLRRRPTDLVGVVRTAVRSCTVEEGEDRVSIEAPSRVVVRADAAQLRGVVANVVRNALWYSLPEGRVGVTVQKSNGDVTLSVRDVGPGVTDAEREAIFDPFVRGVAGRGARGGRGLGLFIARRVIEAHGGTIWVESSPPGATFHIRLPAGADARNSS